MVNIDTAITSMLRKDLTEVSRKTFARGLTSGTSGNLSARVPENPEQVLIKSSGKCFGDLCEADFVLVDLEGNILDGGFRPSKEVRFHCGIYKIRPDVNAIVHGHSAYATAYVAVKGRLPVVTAAAETGLSRVGIVEYADPGSEELAKMVIDIFTDHSLKAAVLKRHGFVTLGSDIFNAYYFADMLEDNARVATIIAQISK